MTKSSIARRQRFYAYSILIKSFLSRLFSVVCQYALERDFTAHWAKKNLPKNLPLTLLDHFPLEYLVSLLDHSYLFMTMIFSLCMVNRYIHILPFFPLDTKLMNNILILSQKKKLMTLNTKCHKYLFTKRESELRKSTTVI